MTLNLEIKHGDRKPIIVRKQLRTQLVVGKRGQGITINDERLGMNHALFYVEEGKDLWVCDLLSDAGVYLAGRRVTRRKLLPGDRLRMGATWITIISF